MAEWNALIKPILYAWALVFCTVVLGLTADKLLLRSAKTNSISCAFRGSIGTCVYTIIIGTLSFLLTATVAAKRLIVTFSDDKGMSIRFPKVMEALWWGFLSLWWFITAIVVTSRFGVPGEIELKPERVVVVTFSWMLWGGYAMMAVVAWLAPETDSDAVYEEIRQSIKVRRAAERAEREERERREREEAESTNVEGRRPRERLRFWQGRSAGLQRSPLRRHDYRNKKPQSAPPVGNSGSRGYSWSPVGVFRRRMSRKSPFSKSTGTKSDAAASGDNVRNTAEGLEENTPMGDSEG